LAVFGITIALYDVPSLPSPPPPPPPSHLYHAILPRNRCARLTTACIQSIGLSYALVTADLFHIFLKLFIGSLRPNFYDVCQPVPSLPGAGYRGTYFTPAICTTTDTHALNYAMMSFPSGHSTAAFASSVFLAL
jgi:membrane-associated phospholipid phosphatase